MLSPCPCSEELKQQLTSWLVDLAGVDFRFVQGTRAILTAACQIKPPACMAAAPNGGG